MKLFNKLQIAIKHLTSLRPNKNKFKNQEIVLVGCGPSVRYYKLHQKAYYAAVNRAFLYSPIKFDFIFAQDNLEQEMFAAAQYHGSRCQKFFGCINKKRYQEEWVKALNIRPIPNSYFNREDVIKYYLTPKKFEQNIGYKSVADNGGTALSACQILLYLGFRRIWLVGIDNTYDQHFYGGKMEDFSKQILFWKQLKHFCEKKYPEVEIISINPMGLKGIFKNVYTREYCTSHPELALNEVEFLD